MLNLVISNGRVPSAFCANATSSLLSQVPGFEGTSKTFYPVKLMDEFETLPNVTTTKYYENDEGDVIDAVQSAQLTNNLPQ
jgi:hypothetical protein